jgi:hypothetical protein
MRSLKTEYAFAKYVALISGVIVSLIAGYISVTGLAALFPAGGPLVMVMAASMEVGKVVAVACWRHTTGALRALLTGLIAVLILITGLGVYGFLSSSNQADRAPALAAAAQAESQATQLTLAREVQARAERDLQQLDAAVNALMQLNRITQANSLRGSQAQERTRLAATIAASVEEQRTIIARQAEARTVATHSELSPIRFAAHALNWGDEEAVQLMILMLMLAFDPLGLVLVAIGSEVRASKKLEKKKRAVKAQRSKRAARPKVGSMLAQARREMGEGAEAPQENDGTVVKLRAGKA